MPSWNALVDEFQRLGSNDAATKWMQEHSMEALRAISGLRGDRHVLLYGSAFLQKPSAQSSFLSIGAEDLNGLMAVIYGMDWSKGLTLVLHTPGGAINATESIVDYLHSKFEDIEVIIPALAMSAGTMVALSSKQIWMGRQSQLGPIDPQMGVGGRSVSAQAIVDQFRLAKTEVLANPTVAHAWAPVLQSLGPALLVEAQNALDYGETMVARWLERYMFAGEAGASSRAASVAHHFNDAGTHKSHGRRINMAEVASTGVHVSALEGNQRLQEEVLTLYHLMTLAFEHGDGTKLMWADTGKMWIKNWVDPQRQPQRPIANPTAPAPSAPAQRGAFGQPAQNREQRRQGRRQGK